MLFNLHPLPGIHIMNIFRNFTGMISTPFEVTGNKDIIGAARDAFRVFHHVGDTFAEDRLPEGVDGIITGEKSTITMSLSRRPSIESSTISITRSAMCGMLIRFAMCG